MYRRCILRVRWHCVRKASSAIYCQTDCISLASTGSIDNRRVIKMTAAHACRACRTPRRSTCRCGLKGMEAGVEEALADICRAKGLDWSRLKPDMRAQGRYHVETY